VTAQLLTLEVFLDGMKISGGATARVDLQDAESTEQLDEHLRTAAREHGHAAVPAYSMRVLDQDGRVKFTDYRTID
jgi:hypothetical protein